MRLHWIALCLLGPIAGCGDKDTPDPTDSGVSDSGPSDSGGDGGGGSTAVADCEVADLSVAELCHTGPCAVTAAVAAECPELHPDDGVRVAAGGGAAWLGSPAWTGPLLVRQDADGFEQIGAVDPRLERWQGPLLAAGDGRALLLGEEFRSFDDVTSWLLSVGGEPGIEHALPDEAGGLFILSEARAADDALYWWSAGGSGRVTQWQRDAAGDWHESVLDWGDEGAEPHIVLGRAGEVHAFHLLWGRDISLRLDTDGVVETLTDVEEEATSDWWPHYEVAAAHPAAEGGLDWLLARSTSAGVELRGAEGDARPVVLVDDTAVFETPCGGDVPDECGGTCMGDAAGVPRGQALIAFTPDGAAWVVIEDYRESGTWRWVDDGYDGCALTEEDVRRSSELRILHMPPGADAPTERARLSSPPLLHNGIFNSSALAYRRSLHLAVDGTDLIIGTASAGELRLLRLDTTRFD